MKFITIDLDFNLLFVYIHNGGSQMATQDCPITSSHAFSYDVCEGELGGNEGIRMCVWVSVYVCGVYGVLQCTTRKTMLNRELPFSKMKK